MSDENEFSASVDRGIEACYTDFYTDILNSLYDFKNRKIRMSVKASLGKLKKRNLSEAKVDDVSVEDMDYSFEENRCAYIYQYSILHSKMVNFHFKKFLEHNIDIRKKLEKMKNVRICCLSGGVGIDAIVIVKVISDLWSKIASKAKTQKNIEITIIDKCSEWQEGCLKIWNIVKAHPQLNISSEINIHVDFIKRNVLQPFDDILKNGIKKAHFVTMVKFVKDIQHLFPEKTSAVIQEIIENVTGYMRVGGCFFIVDNGGGGIPRAVQSVFKNDSLWSEIYDPISHVTHTLQSDTVRKFSRLVLPGVNCSRETKVFSNIWIKMEFEHTKITLKGKYDEENFKKRCPREIKREKVEKRDKKRGSL